MLTSWKGSLALSQPSCCCVYTYPLWHSVTVRWERGACITTETTIMRLSHLSSWQSFGAYLYIYIYSKGYERTKHVLSRWKPIRSPGECSSRFPFRCVIQIDVGLSKLHRPLRVYASAKQLNLNRSIPCNFGKHPLNLCLALFIQQKKKLPTTICDNDGNLLGLIYAIWCSDLGLKVTYFLEFHIWNFYERISGISKQQIWRIFLKHKRIKPRSINGYGEKELRDAQKILVHGHRGSWIYTTYNYNVSRLWLVV